MRVYCRQTKAIVFARLIEQGLTSPSTQSKLPGRQFYGSKGPTNSIKVLKEKKDATKVKKTKKKANNTKIQQNNKHTVTHTHTKKHRKSPSLQ